MYFPSPQQCWDVIAKLRGYKNIAKKGGGNENEMRFSKVFLGFCLRL